MNMPNESALREILEQSLAGYWDWDIQSGDEYMSPTFKKMFGYEDHEIPNRADSWQKLIFAEDLPGVLKTFDEHAKSMGAIPYHNEVRYRHKDGSTVWVICTGKIIEWDDAGNPIRMVGCHVDITDRRRAEEAIRASQEHLRVAAENLDGIIWIVDNNLRFILSKGMGLGKMGLKPDQVVGMSMYDFLHTTDPNHPSIANHLRVLQGATAKYENAFGGRVYSSLLSPVKDSCGNITGVLGLTLDITERKVAENALADEKERLAVTLRSIGDGVIATDIQGNVTLMNNVAEELTGWKQDEAQGLPLSTVFRIISEDTREPRENPVDKVLATGQIVELANHTVIVSRRGTERIIADSAAPIRDHNGKTIGVVLVFRDTTEKQKLLEATQNIQKLESLGALAGGIAHDFNNLLGGIFGYIDLANGEPDRSRMSSHLSKALATIDRARALSSQLLTFAKGGVPIQKVGRLFPFVEETARFALSGANVSCDFDVQEDLWMCSFDKNQIGQVIDNLVINAQQAMPVGGRIQMSARNVTLAEKEHPTLRRGTYVKISIKDSGVGIHPTHLSRIFDPFFTTKSRGHGLGLATCYSIINRHAGCIDVESELGKGSTFHVYLPATTDALLSLPGELPAQHRGQGTFLVMDDEEVMRETISGMLKSLGYAVVCKDHGRDAVDFFADETRNGRKLSGIILDLTIPGGMGGKAAVEEIRKLDVEVPVYVASGYAEDPIMKNPLEYGFTASISKPFRKSDLAEMLNRFSKT